MMSTHTRGFTLIELMIVVVIAAILFAVAIPSYRGYVQRSNRTDATMSLLRVSTAQERYYLQNGRYTNSLDALGVPTTERGYYDLSIENADARGYKATATVNNGPQKDDSDCTTFTINEKGQRTSKPEPLDFCWR